MHSGHMRTMVIALVVAAWASRANGGTPKFSIDDLQTLDKQQAWQELFDHLGDIPPAKRDAKWQGFLERSALGILKAHEARVEEAASFADLVTRQYPQVKSSKAFMARRAEVGLRGLEACVNAEAIDSCLEGYLAFVDADPGNLDLAWRAGVLVAKGDHAGAVPFFRRGLGGKKNAKLCGEPSLEVAVGSALSLDPKDPRVADAKLIGGDLCWDQLKEGLVGRFADGNDNYRRNSCGFLKTKKDALGPLSLRQCNAIKP